MKNRTWVALVCVLDLGLVGLAVADRLSARLTGEEIRLRVEPVDPIDPFRGAYVDLGYPGITDRSTEQSGDAYVSLSRRGEVWAATAISAERPNAGRS